MTSQDERLLPGGAEQTMPSWDLSVALGRGWTGVTQHERENTATGTIWSFFLIFLRLDFRPKFMFGFSIAPRDLQTFTEGPSCSLCSRGLVCTFVPDLVKSSFCFCIWGCGREHLACIYENHYTSCQTAWYEPTWAWAFNSPSKQQPPSLQQFPRDDFDLVPRVAGFWWTQKSR